MDSSIGKELQVSYFETIWAAVASIGWYIVAIAVSFSFAFPYIKEKYTRWKLRKDEQEYAAKYHKNSDLLQERLSALEASRQKMQEEYYQKCTLAQQERIEQKRRTQETLKLDTDDTSVGYRLGNKDDDGSSSMEKKHKSIREEYNPLMGDGSRGYRPPKRTCCRKGGCS